jgi:type II secretory pathway pseudopilin PulG
MSLSARFRRSRDEEGIGLVEVIVSIGVSAMVLLAVLATSVFAVRASADARKNQQAADYLNSAVEAVRGLSYASVSMLTSDLGTDSNIVTVGGVKKYDPGSGLEPIDATTSGLVTPHIADADPGKNATNGSYKVYRYVTVPSTATYNGQGLPSVRRLSVVVTWKVRGSTHTRRTSTLLTNTRRGLPLPNYTFKYNGPATMVGSTATWTKNPGNAVSYGLVLNNLGARDSWTITASTSGWTFYVDTDHDGLWGGLATEPLLNPVNTGLIEPGSAPVYIVAYRVIAATESGTTSTTFTAASDSQPTYPTRSFLTSLIVTTGAVVVPTATPSASASASASPSPTASAGACTPGTATAVDSSGTVPAGTTNSSYTLSTVYLFNGTTQYDTTTQATNTMGTDSSGWHASLCNWSTDTQTTQAGRLIPNSTSVAEWRFQPGSAAQDQMRGTPVLTFWVQCVSAGTPSITVKLQTLSGTTYTLRATATAVSASGGACPTTGFAKYYASLPFSGFFQIALTDRVVVQVSSSLPIRVGYGTAGLPAKLEIGMK